MSHLAAKLQQALRDCMRVNEWDSVSVDDDNKFQNCKPVVVIIIRIKSMCDMSVCEEV